MALFLISTARAQVSGAGQLGCSGTPVTGTVANSGTANNTVLYTTPYLVGNQLLVTLDQTTTITGGAATFQEDSGDGNFITLDSWRLVDSTTAPFATIGNPYTFVASTNKQFLILTSGLARIQLKLTTALTGTGAVTPFFELVCYQLPLAFQATSANLSVNNNAVQVAGVSLGASAVVNFGSAPAASGVQAVNANIFSAGAAITAGAPLAEQLSQGNAALSATNGLYTNLLQGNAVLSATNPIFFRPTDGTNAMGLMANFGTSPGAVTSLDVNASLFAGTTALGQTGGALNTTDAADGSATAGTAANKALLIGCDYNTSLPALQNGQQVAIQCDSQGRLLISPQTVTSYAQALTISNSLAKAVVAGTFGRPVTSTGDALDVNVKYPLAPALPSASVTASLTSYTKSAVTSTQVVKTGGGNLWAWIVYNPNTSVCFLDFFNTTTPTLGATVPVWTIPAPGSGQTNVAPGQFAFANFSTAISVAAVTASGGATTCTTGETVSLSIY